MGIDGHGFGSSRQEGRPWQEEVPCAKQLISDRSTMNRTPFMPMLCRWPGTITIVMGRARLLSRAGEANQQFLLESSALASTQLGREPAARSAEASMWQATAQAAEGGKALPESGRNCPRVAP